MSVLICKLGGSRGRSIDIYDNKCVITTDVTVGSVLTHNALDGQKTVFYIDISGIQFKKSSLAIGYLQLETASMQMNNQSSNMFSENTYTFEEGINGVNNDLIEKVHNYIVDKVEGYKYGITPDKQSLYALVTQLKKTRNYINGEIVKQVDEDLQQQEQQKEQERLQKEKQEQEAIQRATEEMRRVLQEKGGRNQIAVFLEQVASCTRVNEILKLWENMPKENNAAVDEISKKISRSAQIERMYGANLRSTQKLLEEIREIALE